MGRLLSLALLCCCVAQPQSPVNLRAGGSNWQDVRLSFALHPSRPIHFQWAPQHLTNGATQTAYQIVVQSAKSVVWDSGKISSARPNGMGPVLKPGVYEWKVTFWDEQGVRSPDSKWATFRVAPGPETFDTLKWLGSDTDTLYRAEYTVPGGCSDLVLHVLGLGYSHVTVDGSPANSELHLTTGPWTNNERFNGFSSISLPLSPGTHAVGIELGHGWRDLGAFPNQDNDQGADKTERVVVAQVVATLGNGSSVVLTETGDGTWYSSPGAVIADSVYDGEQYDARIAAKLAGWDRVGGGKGWKLAQEVANPPRGNGAPWSAPPVLLDSVRQPVSVKNPYPNIYVVDFGANLAGVCQLKGLQCKEGSIVQLTHAEIMQHAGLPDLPKPDPTMIYTGNLRSALATDTYICNGQGPESWSPMFTYHGFRFVEVNVSKAPGLSFSAANIEMHHFHSGTPQKAFVNFTSETLNKIQKMALGAQRSNLMTVITDCDQRDERLGWMGDANLSGDSILMNFDAVAFVHFFLDIIASEVDSDGSIPDVVPFMRYGGRPADVSWSAAFVNLVHALWVVDGDSSQVERLFPFLMKNLANVQAQAAQGVGKMHTPYGDWCPPPEKIGGGQGPKPSAPYTSAYSYLNMIKQLFALAAGPLGNATLAAQLSNLNINVTAEFNKAFYKGNGTYDSAQPTQTASALALALGISPAESATANLLIADVESRKTHFSTGIIGWKALLEVLLNEKRPDISLALLSQTDYPSIGFNFANELEPASENLWELQDALGEGTGMNSRNHHMFSSFSEYLVKHVSGLQPMGPGSLRLSPYKVANELSQASVLLKLAEGDAELNWQKEGGIQTAKASEGDVAVVDCGTQGTLQTLLFASHGTPFLANRTMQIDPTCHSDQTQTILKEQCFGKSSCKVLASRELFKTECPNRPITQPLKLWMQWACDQPSVLKTQAKIPVTSSAELRLPLDDFSSKFTLRLGSEIIFPSTAALPAGIQALTLSRDANMLSVQLGSGSYDFTLA